MTAPVILAFGDSLIAGYGVEPSQSFAAQLEVQMQTHQAGIRVINAGVSGDTTSDALARLPQVLEHLAERPDLAIVQLGANDLLRRTSLKTIRANLDAIIAELKRNGIPVLLATIEAPVFFGAFGRACAAVYQDLSNKHAIRCASFLPRGMFGSRTYCLRDRLHPNAHGISTIAKRFRLAVIAALPAAGEAEAELQPGAAC
ncbi:arylesterase [Sphingomonas sp. SRS2]|uniref:arylesterase n=1 Tax=Sphingomonas sp. SRS2 TaxID=133190 RepID=UPI000AEF786A|nr:arylesterase [Sphingomonas sp. SRS2]